MPKQQIGWEDFAKKTFIAGFGGLDLAIEKSDKFIQEQITLAVQKERERISEEVKKLEGRTHQLGMSDADTKAVYNAVATVLSIINPNNL